MLTVSSPLTFDPEPHEYRLNGVLVPSVTRVLRQTGYVDLSGIWPDVLEAARARGQRVHRALHYLLENDLDIHTVDEQDRGYVESAAHYLARELVRPIRVECRLWSERYGCAGTTDLIALHRDGWVSIDDFKTGEPSDVAADLQTGAYHGFALEMANWDTAMWRDLFGGWEPKLVRRRSIRLFGDGRPARDTIYSDHRDYVRFLNALTVVQDLWKRPAPTPWDEER